MFHYLAEVDDAPVMEFRPTVPQSVLRAADMLKKASFVFKFIERVMVSQPIA